MHPELLVLASTAATIAFVHTIIGVDHYLPLTAVSAAKNWSMRKLAMVTTVIGFGHILGSVLLGFVGIAIRAKLDQLGFIESLRGEIAAWLLVAFGLVYAVWGLRHAYKKKAAHTHYGMENTGFKLAKFSPFAILVIFIIGPCEPLIPILMYPAMTYSVAGMVLVTTVFAVVTMLTMLGAVLITSYGLARLRHFSMFRFGHTACGATISACGLAIIFLGT